ncbi:MAG: hypothetical protein ABI467_06835 [Kofleriaceae bacterium]
MSNDDDVLKLGSAAALAIKPGGHELAKQHAGADAEIHERAEVWRLYKGPGDNDYVVCPNNQVGPHGWEAAIGDRLNWPSSLTVHVLCIIIRPTGSVPIIGPIEAGTMYLRKSVAQGQVKGAEGIDQLREQLKKVDWTQDKQRWVARTPKDNWMIIEHP